MHIVDRIQNCYTQQTTQTLFTLQLVYRVSFMCIIIMNDKSYCSIAQCLLCMYTYINWKDVQRKKGAHNVDSVFVCLFVCFTIGIGKHYALRRVHNSGWFMFIKIGKVLERDRDLTYLIYTQMKETQCIYYICIATAITCEFVAQSVSARC